MNLELYKKRVENNFLSKIYPFPLFEAMKYSFLNGGKRFRAALVYAIAEDYQIPLVKVDSAALALETIHAYSLIHDDLPALDNDDFRRGVPSCHKKFNEATAILAGDALQSYAFTILSRDISATKQLPFLAEHALGMVFGQDIDVRASVNNLDNLRQMHILKTGGLIKAALNMGAVLSPDFDPSLINKIGDLLGVIYQIQDDILDVTAASEVLGKTAGKDSEQNKVTYVTLLGLENAQSLLQQNQKELLEQLDKLPNAGKNLRQLIELIFRRQY